MAYIEVKHESKRYKMGETIITANNDINFTADQGKLTVILGPSGAGKSTLLRTCLVSFKNYLQEGQYNHLKTAVKGAFTVFPKSPTFV
ncbi:MAG: ATP-binding cassette domain-containing protein [Oenococcus oeni]